MGKVAITNERVARIVYEEFAGETIDEYGSDYILIGIPDDSGMNAEDPDGEEVFRNYGTLYISENTMEQINKEYLNG